jgi:L-fuconolactonase
MIVDTHVHFWDPAERDYGWLSPELGALYRAFTPEHLDSERSANAVASVVVVQAAHSVRETEHLLGLAESHRWIGAVVGWMPFERPAEAARVLDELTARPRFRGVRHMVFGEEPDWLGRPAVLESVAQLEAAGVLLEVPVATVHLEHVAALAAAFPDLCIVVDHLAQPPPAGTSAHAAWRDAFVRLSEFANVSAKVSGLHVAEARRVGATAVAVRAALSAFGCERLMFGSDWPVCLSAGTYEDVVRATISALLGVAPSERMAVLSGTARDVYRLALDPPGRAPTSMST